MYHDPAFRTDVKIIEMNKGLPYWEQSPSTMNYHVPSNINKLYRMYCMEFYFPNGYCVIEPLEDFIRMACPTLMNILSQYSENSFYPIFNICMLMTSIEHVEEFKHQLKERYLSIDEVIKFTVMEYIYVEDMKYIWSKEIYSFPYPSKFDIIKQLHNKITACDQEDPSV